MDNRALRIIQRQGANKELHNAYRDRTEHLVARARYLSENSSFKKGELDEVTTKIRIILSDLKDIHNLLSRPHTSSCEEKHSHVWPLCCDNECWCLEIRC